MSTPPICCEMCQKQPQGICGRCEECLYCSIEHQREHWQNIHKHHCSIFRAYRLRTSQVQINNKRLQLRRKYFTNFSHKVYDSCIQIAEQLVELQKNCMKNTSQIFNQLQYGISICLLCRNYLIVKNQAKAIVFISNYVEQKMHFLQDMRDIAYLRQSAKRKNIPGQLLHQQLGNESLLSPKGGQLTQNSIKVNYNLTKSQLILRQLATKKISLIAGVANILYAVKLPVMRMYQLYTQIIQGIFGSESLQVSNCFFMIGSYYFQSSQYYKAIACFMRAAELRANMAGDCYYNLGIIYQLLNQPKIALMMFENAAKMKANQFGENSSEVANVYHNIAIILKSLGNFKRAIEYLQKVALIFSKNKSSQQYKKVKQTIKQLQKQIKIYLKKIQQKNTGIQTINQIKKIKTQAELKAAQKLKLKQKEKQKQTGQKNFLIISQQLLNNLNSLQTKLLAELQIQLRQCSTIFMAATVVGNCNFLRELKGIKQQQLKKDNQILFSHIQMEELLKKQSKFGGPQQAQQ